jgi:transcriptional regulator with XRE-family HTH domain
MPADAPRPDGLLASRLDLLFRTVHPAGRGPYTPAEVAAVINASEGAETISATYLWQLKTGRRDNPTYKHLIALARFFDVSPTFFFPDSETQRGEVPAEVKLALRDDSIRQIALRAAGLSERSLTVIADMVSNARTLEDSRPRRGRRATQQADEA